jgi:GT2 family glycosyltransferase
MQSALDPPTTSTDLSIVIVNWNSVEPLSVCLASLCRADVGTDFEVIVVDNASYDGCGEKLRAHHPAVKFIQSKENLGFARANNLGASYARGRLLLFLNPDTEIVGSAVRTMTGIFAVHTDAGIVGCRLLNGDLTLQTTCVLAFPSTLNELLDCQVLRRAFPKFPLWGTTALLERGPKTIPVQCVSGACLMIRREVFDRVGKFTPDYFMYVEDRDLCYKVHEAGYKTYFTNSAEVVHFGGSSSDRRTEGYFSTIMRQQSMLTFMRQHHGIWHAAVYRLATFSAAAGRLCLLAIGRVVAYCGAPAPAPSSFNKWCRILRWSMGLESWAG